MSIKRGQPTEPVKSGVHVHVDKVRCELTTARMHLWLGFLATGLDLVLEAVGATWPRMVKAEAHGQFLGT